MSRVWSPADLPPNIGSSGAKVSGLVCASREGVSILDFRFSILDCWAGAAVVLVRVLAALVIGFAPGAVGAGAEDCATVGVGAVAGAETAGGAAGVDKGATGGAAVGVDAEMTGGAGLAATVAEVGDSAGADAGWPGTGADADLMVVGAVGVELPPAGAEAEDGDGVVWDGAVLPVAGAEGTADAPPCFASHSRRHCCAHFSSAWEREGAWDCAFAGNPLTTTASGSSRAAVLTANRKSAIENRQSMIGNRQSAIGNRKSVRMDLSALSQSGKAVRVAHNLRQANPEVVFDNHHFTLGNQPPVDQQIHRFARHAV